MSRPNIVVVILDALRARNVSCYGYEHPTTPRLDAFAREHVLFRRAFSAATWTVPSHASLLTGLYVSQHRVESIEADRQFNEEIVTLPEALGQHGYRTAAFSQNMLFGPGNHLDRGFGEFHSIEELLRRRPVSRWINRVADGRGRFRLAARYLQKMIAPRRLLDAASEWIEQDDGERPFFAMINVLAPHFPWTVPPSLLLRQRLLRPRYLLRRDYLTLKQQWEFNAGRRAVTAEHRRVWQRLYDACVMHADQEMGRFLARLRRWSGWNNTIVVITSDHGELLGDYRNLVGHVLSLHDNLIHVPLIVRHPDWPGGTEVQGVVQTLDLYRSALEWAGRPLSGIPAAQLQRPALSEAVARPAESGGYAISEEDYTDSYDVLGKLCATEPSFDPAAFPTRQVAVRSATHKYVWRDDGRHELYDLTSDPDEQQNAIADTRPAIRHAFEQLEHVLDQWNARRETFPPQEADQPAELDDVALERLRALGYVL